jgi:hypothetical protein
MSEDPQKPFLRVVTPDEKTPPPAPAEPAIPPAVPEDIVSKERLAFAKAVDAVDAARPLSAGFLVCTGLYLADAALAFHHQAVAHAAPGVFYRDVPPGLKSAEATRAWLGTHLEAVKALAEDKTVEKYSRATDLQAGAKLAAAELDRALGVSKAAGLWFADRHAALFADVAEDLGNLAAYYGRGVQPAVIEPEVDIYILGCEALSTL